MFDVWGSKLFSFHTKIYMTYMTTYIIINLQKTESECRFGLVFLTSQYIVDTIDVFSEKRESRT